MKNVKITMVFGLLLLSLVWGIVVPSNKSAQSKTYQPNEFDTVQITVHEGWNLISIPLIVPDGRVSVLFPSAISSAFKYNGSYIPCDTLEPGVGYWLKFAASESFTIIGTISEFSVDVKRGWNMIGSPNEKIAVTHILLYPCEIITSNYFAYDSTLGYVQKDTLEPGKGYWVKVNQPGVLFDEKIWIKISDLVPSALAVDPVEPRILYAGTSSNFGAGTRGNIFKSTNRGASWDTLVYDVHVTSIRIDPQNTSIVYASSGTANPGIIGILKTTDAGMTWFHADSGMYLDWENGPYIMGIDPNNTNILYADVGGVFGGYQYKTTNGGKYWFRLIRYDTLDCNKDTLCVFSAGMNLAIDPHNSNVLYAVSTLVPSYWRNILFQSSNGGTSWEIISRFSPDYYLCDVEVDMRDSNIIYVGTRGVLRTTDRGLSWYNWSNGLPDTEYIGNFRLSKQHNVMYVEGGVGVVRLYETTDGGMNWFQLCDLPGEAWVTALDDKDGFLYATKFQDGIYIFPIREYSNCK